ncbi:MAG TPA: TonB-dependent receptor, partial [Pyrinomonadaceae bacterium]
RVNLRTRSGSNSLRGRLSYLFADESLDANTWNNNKRGLKRLPLQEHRPSLSLGGPLRLPTYDGRGRTFFFVAWERRHVLDSTLIDVLVPVEQNPSFTLPHPTTLSGRRFEPEATPPNPPAELAPFIESVSTPLRSTSMTARLDHEYSKAHNGAFLFQLGRSENLRQFGGGSRLADGLQGRRRDTDALAYTDNLVLSPAVVNQLRAQASRLRPSIRAAAPRPVVLITIEDPLSSESNTLVAGSSTSGATDRSETRFQLQETLTLVRGAHTFKLGADFQRVRSVYRDLADATGTYSFASAGDFLSDAPSRFRQRFGAESAQRNTYAGIFFQGELHPAPRLTLTAGLRYERESVLEDRDNLAPRLGLALDPTGKGKSVLRAGFGVFYNRALLRTIDDFTLGRSVVEFDTNNLPSSQRRAFIDANLRFPKTLTPDSPLVRDFGARLTDFSRRLDPELKIPESYQANVGFERELGRGFVVEANYTFNRGLHLWREFNANAARLPTGFGDFTEYLLSRDFANFRGAGGARPIYGASTAGE